MVVSLSLEEVIRQLEFFEGEAMSEGTTQPRITLADLVRFATKLCWIPASQSMLPFNELRGE